MTGSKDPTGGDPKETRRPEARLCFETTEHRTQAGLERQGVEARQLGPRPDLEDLLDLTEADSLVLGVGEGEEADAALRLAEDYRNRGGKAKLVLLGTSQAEAHLRWAGELTPFWYPRSLPAESLARFIGRTVDSTPGTPLPTEESSEEEVVESAEVRRLTLRLWESFEIDGAPIFLGPAERNFLHGLGMHRGAWISKEDSVDAGAGNRVPTKECRRRLGKRLGDELASLLVPSERGEPYRLREPEEVVATCKKKPDRHQPTELRIVGRAQVRTVGLPDLENFANED
ncbi:MAG: hypothetical protein AAF533_05775 [Acidobacteriota bacterium]